MLEQGLVYFLTAVLGNGKFDIDGVWSLPENVLSLCARKCEGQGTCDCLQDIMANTLPSPVGITEQRYISTLLLFLLNLITECPCIDAMIKSLISKVAQIIEDATGDWGKTDWHTTEDAYIPTSCNTRRKIGPHAKQYAVRHAVEAGKAATVHQARRSMAATSSSDSLLTKWIGTEVFAYTTSAWLSFAPSRIFAVSIDCLRIGCPCREMMLGVVSDMSRRINVAFAPQDWSSGTPGPTTVVTCIKATYTITVTHKSQNPPGLDIVKATIVN